MAAWQLSQKSESADHLGQIYEKRGATDQAEHFFALAMNARRPDPETRSRLNSLSGGQDKADALVEKIHEELLGQRTIRIGKVPGQEGKADFFLLLSNGQGSEMSVEEVKFAGGNETMKGFTDGLRQARYGQTHPDETLVKAVRRGTLSCAAASADCTFVLALPSDVRSVD